MRCPACGTTNPPAQRYCGSCAAALLHAESETMASPVPSRRTPTRLGLFAFLVAVLSSSWDGLGPTIHSSSWFFPQSVVTIAIFALVAVFGFWVSLGDQKVFKDSLLER